MITELPKRVLMTVVLVAALFDVAPAQQADLMLSGQKAYSEGKYEDAEKLFTRLVEQAPDDYKALRSLAETKIKLKKYRDAETLIERILSMPPARGRNVKVYLEGDPEPHDAEIVDERVMAVDESEQDPKGGSSFVKQTPKEPVPHYRVFLKKTGKMKLLPKSKTRIQYQGIPTAVRDLALEMKSQIRKNLIATQGAGAREELVSVPAGCFRMGSDRGDPDERPVHQVCISAFQMGKYEVRQKNFQTVMSGNPSQNVGADLPVDSVTWDEASDYCKKQGLRLPTEAEWEYAARAGTTTPFYWGPTVSGKEANFCDHACELNIRESRVADGFKHTAPVGSFPPNAFGLHDMAGNVSEWVQDWMNVATNYYQVSPKKDPPGPRTDLEACMRVDCIGAQTITNKVYRGGGWNQRVAEMRSANRRDSHFQLRSEGVGFRCAQSLKSP
ncbi:MAG: SUMF1/EgtB/PvdO family nonheme iron enzyme [Nitrospinaceae bacterium]|nr:SUMF1/EgtB/PvdO family nonheme iron enzyme [Nitrospinaceae bacterium]NIR53994.1 SUMF1/EgtB/PvdO family nonheme iron enzyme [Nitrospinaceae bacterium]NIS84413.1 SUMF1/EgtB/PvdO family nonheme iron enzyme [Nitrospinaceae bacterium]NIT81204.1 SUMF1/EgtB/PvdO family nonheme iron enzyme [Nitrospinaceae bacterium]NIU43493.1 SUMF1/EgtB/PvdO family nonheme iron enzyme [Nitrospinaceae bacterium]